MPKPSTGLDTVFNAKVGDLCRRIAGWNENAKSGEDTASLEAPITPAENTQTEPPITRTLMQPDEGGEIPADDTQSMFAVPKKESVPNTNDFLIDSGDATSVCRQNFADSLGRKTRRPGVKLRSATRHQVHNDWQYDNLLAYTRRCQRVERL